MASCREGNLPRISSTVLPATPKWHVLACLLIDWIALSLIGNLLLASKIWNIHGGLLDSKKHGLFIILCKALENGS